MEVSLSAQEGFRLLFLVFPLTDFVSPWPPCRPGWEVKRGHSVHDTANPLAKPAASRQHGDKTFDTPFDDRGCCHHHPQVQMATKKVQGRWKILTAACSKCIEADYNEQRREERRDRLQRGAEAGRRAAAVGGGEEATTPRSIPAAPGSAPSRPGPIPSPRAPTTTRTSAAPPTPPFRFPRRSSLGGWKEYRICPKCLDLAYNDMSDNASVRSGMWHGRPFTVSTTVGLDGDTRDGG